MLIKWAGGKTKILSEFSKLYNIANPRRIIDLFCGSLALPLQLKPREAIFNDININLINVYKNIKNNLEELITMLEELNSTENNTKEAFNSLRDEYNKYKNEGKCTVRQSAIFIYLNKRSFNGLYRENRSGKYNVPFRHYKSSIYSKKELREISLYFNENNIKFTSVDFCDIDVTQFRCDDLVYIDPPYYPSKKSQFTSYWKKPFLVEEQKKLAEFCKKLDTNGIKFILSNSPCKEVQELYTNFSKYCFYIGRQMRSGKGVSEVFSDTHESNEILVWNFYSIQIQK